MKIFHRNRNVFGKYVRMREIAADMRLSAALGEKSGRSNGDGLQENHSIINAFLICHLL